MGSIDLLLKSYHANTLKAIAEAAGLRTKDKSGKRLRKSALLKEMKAKFFTRERVLASWNRLSETEQAVVSRLLLHNEASVSTVIFRRELLRAGLAEKAPQSSKTRRGRYHYRPGAPYATGTYVGSPDRAQSRIFEDLIARLTLHGLVFSKEPPSSYSGVSHKLQFHPGQILFIPEEVRRYLPQPEEIPGPLASWQPHRVEQGQPETLLRDLYLYWDFVRSNKVRFIKSGFIGKRHLRAINKILLAPDPSLKNAEREDMTTRLYLLRILLMDYGLLQRVGEMLRPVTVNKDPLHIPDFWELPRFKQRSHLLQIWAELEAGGGLPEAAERYEPDYARARRVIHSVVTQLPPDTWLEPVEILTRVQSRSSTFLFPSRPKIERAGSRYGYYSYYYETTEATLDQLDLYEEQFVYHCLTGFLNQIGLVELGYDEDNRWRGVRLSQEAPALIRGDEKETSQDGEADGGKLILQPNFQLMALGPVKLSLLARVDLFADRERVDVTAFEYRISRDSIYRAHQLGLEPTAVLHFLEEHCQAGIPQNVRRSLEEWEAHQKRITFRTGVTLLEANDEDLLRHLFDDETIGSHLERFATETIAVVRAGRGRALVAALVKKGLFPLISGDDPRSADGSVIIEADGTVRAIHAVPGIHLQSRISALAEGLAPGVWLLTPETIKKAGGGRREVLQILGELEALNHGPLPATLVENVKAWGGYYGRAGADTLTVIEFRDRVAMEELLDHPVLKPYLFPFPTKDRALVVVPTDKLDRVKEILAERFGVRVTDGLRRARRRA